MRAASAAQRERGQSVRQPLRSVGVSLGVLGLLVAGSFIVYGNALLNPFLLDDEILIVDDPRVRSCDLAAIATQQYWPGDHGNLVYRPLTLASLALNWQISQAAWTFRLVNLLLHAAAAFALYLLARPLGGTIWAATAGALLFVVHPIHTTPLNQIVDRADIAAAACVLVAGCLYARDLTGHPARWLWRPLAGAVLFAAALLFKESALALVGWLALLEIAGAAPGRTSSQPVSRAPRVLAWSVGLGVVLVLYVGLRWAVVGSIARPATAISPLDNIVARPEYGLAADESVPLARWGTPLAVLARAVRLLFWPWRLSWDYSYAAIESVRSFADPRMWAGIGAVMAVVGGGVVAYRAAGWPGRDARRALRPARVERLPGDTQLGESQPETLPNTGMLLWAGLTLLLSSYFVVSNTLFVIGAAFAERYLYLPSAGFCLVLGGAADAVRRGLSARTGPWRALTHGWTALAAAVAVLFAGLSIGRNRDFRSLASLNAADVQTQPRSARLWSAGASDSLNATDYATAVRQAERSIEIFPEDPKPWRVAGLAYRGLGQLDAALERLKKSFELGGDDNENAIVAAAEILKVRGDYARAIALLARFVEQRDASLACNNLAWYLVTAEPPTLRDPARALAYARRAVERDPATGDFLDTYVTVLEQLGRPDEAHQALQTYLPRIPTGDPQRAALERKLQTR